MGPHLFLCWSTVCFTCCAEEIVLWFVQSYEESLWKQNIWNLGQFQPLYLTQGTLATDVKVNSSFLRLIVHNSDQVSRQIQLCKIFACVHCVLIKFRIENGDSVFLWSCQGCWEVLVDDTWYLSWSLILAIVTLPFFQGLCCSLCGQFDSHLLPCNEQIGKA